MRIKALCFGLLLALASLATAQPASPCVRASTTILASWPQFGFDPCHTGYNPNEHILSPSNVGGLGEAWEFTTGGFLESQPAVAYGLVYFHSNDGYVYAVSATTGTMAWR